jgi:hypothetical protein
MPTQNVEAGIFLEYRGVTVFHVYRRDSMDDCVQQYQYSLDPDSRYEDAEEYQNFDIRELAAYKAGCSGKWGTPEHWVNVLKLAIDRGELNELIASAITDGNVDQDVGTKCSDCGSLNEFALHDWLGSVCPDCKRGTLEVFINQPAEIVSTEIAAPTASPAITLNDEGVWNIAFGDVDIIVDRTEGLEIRVWRNGHDDQNPLATFEVEVP